MLRVPMTNPGAIRPCSRPMSMGLRPTLSQQRILHGIMGIGQFIYFLKQKLNTEVMRDYSVHSVEMQIHADVNFSHGIIFCDICVAAFRHKF